jgi:hypothetical protein
VHAGKIGAHATLTNQEARGSSTPTTARTEMEF